MVKLFRLGDIFWEDTQLIYHALANLNIEAVVLSSPIERYVCLGLHQNPNDELDLEYCHDNNIQFFRREIGGGTVWLDNRQVFYNIILHRDNPLVPSLPQNYFHRFLKPVIAACDEFGLDARFQPICDLLVNGRKFSGNGGGEIGDCKVIAGGILLDFEVEGMADILKLTPTMREYFRKSMMENLTTIKRELGHAPPKEELFDSLARNFESLLGELELAAITPEIRNEMERLGKYYRAEEWMLQRGASNPGREVKVREEHYMIGTPVNMEGEEHELIIIIADSKVSDVLAPGIAYQKSSDRGLSSKTLARIKSGIMGMEHDQRKIIKRISDIVV